MRVCLDPAMCYQFGWIMRPLYETFESSVSLLSFEALRRSVIAWLNEHCSLLSLRPGFTSTYYLISLLYILHFRLLFNL